MADPSSGSLLAQPEFWVAASFVAFFVVVWKPLRGALVGGLDARAERIRKELDEAQRLLFAVVVEQVKEERLAALEV